MYQKTGWLIGLMLLVGCGEQPKPVEQTQTTASQKPASQTPASQAPPSQAKSEPATAQEPVTQTGKKAAPKKDSTGDDYVDKVSPNIKRKRSGGH